MLTWGFTTDKCETSISEEHTLAKQDFFLHRLQNSMFLWENLNTGLLNIQCNYQNLVFTREVGILFPKFIILQS